ncbi:MAG: polysaccharide deacetylase family protein, partial [Ferruginibacter sp.]
MKRYTNQEIAVCHCYEDAAADEHTINILSDECYLPANEIILSLIAKHKGRFKVSYSISGTTLELFQKYRPDAINSFQQLVATGCVEVLAETYYHSLSFLHSKNEFQRQVRKHHKLVEKLFGVSPSVFRNTELIYNNELAKIIGEMGYKGILCDGNESILQGRQVNQVYSVPGNETVGLLLRNASLSDDIAFRFD